MLQFAKMKKCEFCERSFGQEPFGRHSLHCGRGFSYPHCQHGQEDKYVIKSDDFMQRLEDAFLHAFAEEQTEDSTIAQPSPEPESKLSQFIVVNPSPRIIFQEIVQQQSRGLIVSPEYLPRRRRPSSPGKWRAVSQNKANRGH